MKTLVYIFVVTVFVAVAYAATSRERTDNSAPHAGHCYSKDPKVGAMEKGEVKTVQGDCIRVTCGENTDMTYDSCGSIGLQPGCKLSEPDLTKPYPECCPKEECH